MTWVSFLLLVGANLAAAADWREARQLLLSGNYAGCVAAAESALKEQAQSEEWQLLLSQALLETGKYREAQTVITQAVAANPWSIRLRWQAHEVLQSNGQTEAAAEMVERIIRLVSGQPRAFRDPRNLVVFGRAALLANADPKRVLDTLFDPARKADPKLRDVYLAGGELALEKHDFELAAERFREGLKELPDDPDLHYGLARAYALEDSALMAAAVAAALERNSNHVGSLLLLADYSLDAEDYRAAAGFLDRVTAVNPWHPDAWAYRAVLAHLQNDPEAEKQARLKGLKYWPTNPRVDHLIGLKLSQNYRFAEGAAHQRQALQFDAEYLPAKAQLAQDLLRLGQEEEGWRLAQEVQQRDGYDVEAYNLVALQETMAHYQTLTNRDFILRLTSKEAAVYGARVLDLLSRAKAHLDAKYGLEPKARTIVEVFAEPADFAVRTFGMPGNPGYLGVCFGSVITANSPASQAARPVNWQAVLWHEYCHVVTLQLTRNKMPRWLSEGISVYEERLASPAWGERMNPVYREMVLEGQLKPVAKLSAAFLAPPSSLHLQFAYYQASLVVEYLVQRFGFDALQAVLRELGEGTEVNRALEKHTAPMARIESEFAQFARERALNLAPGLDWEKPPDLSRDELARFIQSVRNSQRGADRTNAPTSFLSRSGLGERMDEDAWKSWAQARPTNFWVLTRQARELTETGQWLEAKSVLQTLVELYPDFSGRDSPYRALAAAHRALGETNAERQVLARLAARDDVALDAYRRLMELGAEAQDWPSVVENAERYLAVAPLVALPYRFLAQASEHTGQIPLAIAAYRAQLELDPPDPAETHFQLARLLHLAGDPGARRHVLQALEEAPRYRAALRLLLELHRAAVPQEAGT